jgi:hypothetical protein
MWLKPENRCLVPANRFAEYAPEPNPETKKDVVWFALNEDRPLFAFAGIRTEYRRVPRRFVGAPQPPCAMQPPFFTKRFLLGRGAIRSSFAASAMGSETCKT